MEYGGLVIALLGMPGSGKSTASAHLSLMGVPVFRLGQVVVDEVRARGLAVNASNEALVRTELRTVHGKAVLAQEAFEWLQDSGEAPLVALDGVYSVDESNFLQARLKDRYVAVSILTDRQIRYARLGMRAERPLDEASARDRDKHEVEHLRKADALILAEHFVVNNDSATELLEGVVRLCHSRLIAGGWSITSAADEILHSSIERLFEIISARSIDDPWSLALLVHRAVTSGSAELQWHVCRAVGSALYRPGTEYLRWVAGQPNVEFDKSSLHGITAWAFARTSVDIEFLLKLLREGATEQQVFAADALGEMRLEEAVSPLARSLREDDPEVALWAALSLAKIGSQEAVGVLVDEVFRSSGRRKYLAFDALARADHARALAVFSAIEQELETDEHSFMTSCLVWVRD